METPSKYGENIYQDAFKSYYVVWKPKYFEAEGDDIFRLNRTM